MGKVTYTIQDPIDGSIQFCNVEQLAIHHYRIEEEYIYGIISFIFPVKINLNNLYSRYSF
jgi:hypothetical protein